MTCCWVVAVWLLAGTSLGAEPGPERVRMSMSPGTQRVFTLPPEVRGFSVRDETVMEVHFLGNRQLLVSALREGFTELVLHGPFAPMRHIGVWVVQYDGCMRIDCVPCRLLPEGHLLQLTFRDQVLGLRGIARSIEEARVVRLIVVRFPNISLDVRLSGRALREGLLRVDHALWRAGFLHARASVREGRVLLRGRFASDVDEARARAAVAPVIAWLEQGLSLPLAEDEATP